MPNAVTLVPEEPTDEMIHRAAEALHETILGESELEYFRKRAAYVVYKAMLAAAPPVPPPAIVAEINGALEKAAAVCDARKAQWKAIATTNGFTADAILASNARASEAGLLAYEIRALLSNPQSVPPSEPADAARYQQLKIMADDEENMPFFNNIFDAPTDEWDARIDSAIASKRGEL